MIIEGLIAIVALLVIWCLILLKRIQRRVDSIGSTRPTEASEQMVRYWRRQCYKHRPGTPKHQAYRQELESRGLEV